MRDELITAKESRTLATALFAPYDDAVAGQSSGRPTPCPLGCPAPLPSGFFLAPPLRAKHGIESLAPHARSILRPILQWLAASLRCGASFFAEAQWPQTIMDCEQPAADSPECRAGLWSGPAAVITIESVARNCNYNCPLDTLGIERAFYCAACVRFK